MKRINKYLSLLLSIMVLASCDSFLDKTPDNRLRLDSYNKIAELVTNAYPQGSGIFLEWMTDNVGPDNKNIQVRAMTQAYCWENIEGEAQDSPSWYWTYNYNSIAHANQALLALEEVNDTKAIEYGKAIKGEALACRAYAHFMLVNVFAKPYNPETAATDLGIVIMRDPETTLLKEYQRSTIKEVYDFIEQDILEAMDLVSDKFYKNTGKYHFNKAALYALASRFFLYKQDYENAEKYSTALLGEGYNPNMVRNYNEVYTGTSSEIMARKFTDPTAPYNLLLVRKEVLNAYAEYTGYRFTTDVLGNIVLSNHDSRFKALYSYGFKVRFLPKFERELFRKISLTSNTGYPYTIEVAFRAEEVLFNRLEAYLHQDKIEQFADEFDQYILSVYQDKVNLGGLYNYYKGTYPDLDDKQLLLKILLDEKQKEFIEEQLRWFDIRRYNLPVTHLDIEGNVHQLAEEDSRKVLQIPETAIKYGGLKPNVIEQPGDMNQQLVKINLK